MAVLLRQRINYSLSTATLLRILVVSDVFLLSIHDTEPTESAARYLAAAASDRHRAVVSFVPRHDFVCESVLEAEGVWGYCIFDSVPLYCMPMAEDVLTLSLPDFFWQCFGGRGAIELAGVSEALAWLEATLSGGLPPIHAVGNKAVGLAGQVAARAADHKATDLKSQKSSSFGGLIVADRTVDLVSPLMPQLTYDGLIDEVWGKDLGTVLLDPSAVDASDTSKNTNGRVRVQLYKKNQEGAAIFEQIRDLNFADVGPLLARRIRRLGAEYDERHGAQNISELKRFVSKLGVLKGEHRELQQHINMSCALLDARNNEKFSDEMNLQLAVVAGGSGGSSASNILERVLDIIHRQSSLISSLRLVCLLFCAQRSLKPRDWGSVLSAIYMSYGYAHLTTVANLGAAGLLPSRGTCESADFKILRRKCVLLLKDGGVEADKDPAYQAMWGYKPLLPTIIDRIAAQGGVDDELRQLLSPHTIVSERSAVSSKCWIVLVLGGITCAELAVMRSLSRRGGRHYLFVVTSLCTAERLLRGAMR